MQAIRVTTPGGPEVLQLATLPDPVPTAEQLLVRVRATALNRADTLQRTGNYPPHPVKPISSASSSLVKSKLLAQRSKRSSQVTVYAR